MSLSFVGTYPQKIDVSVLDWADPTTYPVLEEEWDVVIGADVVWLEHLVPSLVAALNAVCSTNTLLLLSHQVGAVVLAGDLSCGMSLVCRCENLFRCCPPPVYFFRNEANERTHSYLVCWN